MATSSPPDSSISISSLLASCSLGSSRGSASSGSSIAYKDKMFDSASKALEAYIEDYEESLLSPLTSTGKIHIYPSADPGSAKKKGSAGRHIRQKHASGRRYAVRDPDLLSLTTDDLLGFPSDGSLPFSEASERKHHKNVKKRHGTSLRNHSPLSSPLMLSSRTNLSHLHHDSHSLDLQHLKDDFKVKDKNISLIMDRENHPYYNHLNSPYLSRNSALSRSYPRWLTSQKSDLGVSGITSIPGVRYPLWLKDHGLLDDYDDKIAQNLQRSSEDVPTLGSFKNTQDCFSLDCLSSRFYGPQSQLGDESVNSGNCVGRRLHPDLSDLDALRHLHVPLKNGACELPVRKPEGFDPLQKGSPQPAGNNGSPRTEDVLEGERSWEKIPYTLKSPVPVICDPESIKELETPIKSNLADFFNNGLKEASMSGSFSGGNHHGPVEALKHMLFNLQAFQQNFTPAQSTEQGKELHLACVEAESELQKVDQEIFPVNKSLQKALQHLSRLKELVGDGITKEDQEQCGEK
ncbi:lung adenoma susceptibility protein 2 [Hyperolius riggenbachi]|uniref:lung adenoma susceptibility protein 2 n=1 Tax=Hyperolius riggenbachi TaxID=752182 RepID=UPI0035A2B45C